MDAPQASAKIRVGLIRTGADQFVTVRSVPVSFTLRSVFDDTVGAAQGAAPIIWPRGHSVSPLHVSASNVKAWSGCPSLRSW